MIPTYELPAYERMVLTFQTNEYDFYRTFNNGERNMFFPNPLNANVYKIVPKGSPIPTKGYVQPRLALAEHHQVYKVYECFNKPLPIIDFVI